MTKIFVTAGIGDFIASECFFPEDLRKSITKIYYATPAQKEIIQIVSALPNYPNLKEQVIIWKEFNNPAPYCFFHKNHFEGFSKNHNGDPLPGDWNEVEDWSIAIRFKAVNETNVFNYWELSKTLIKQEDFTDYTYSSLIKHKLCDAPSPPLNAVAIAPVTSSFGSPPERNFNDDDWSTILSLLTENNQIGVVLGTGNLYVPNHGRIINLLNQTSILQSIEILKQCHGYYGIDSFMSVLAAKLFDNIRIKSLNSHCYRYKHIYYYPKTNFDFLYGANNLVLHAFGLTDLK
jgi:hypothetical protein